jgi:MFS family permease
MFFVVEACTIFHWSRASDHIGRKPILLVGLAGLSLSMLLFGLSKTLVSLIIRSVIVSLKISSSP